eukprot:GHRR01026640.1.p1 GENE.GHRR01026640.1~~GHRR01026640.1.p1  ORF type:complete len:131 (-),score=41.47 GHRR01026640.1:532-924(-)
MQVSSSISSKRWQPWMSNSKSTGSFTVGITDTIMLINLIRLHNTLPLQFCCQPVQAEDCSLKDFQGDYEYYLSKNETEAVKMEVKQARAAAVEKANTKAKSKMTKAEKERLKKDKAKAFNDAAAGKSKRR